MNAPAVALVVLVGLWVGLAPRNRYLAIRSRLENGADGPHAHPAGTLRHGPRPGRSAVRSRTGRVRTGSAGARGAAGTPGARRAGRSGPAEVAAAADMLAVALAAGRPVPHAVVDSASVIARGRPDSPLVTAAARIERGAAVGDVLEQLAATPGWHGLATQLSISAQAGTPAAAALRQLASQERLRTRRVHERRARRLPVLLLFPLVTMVLPAFALVTVVPFVAAGGLSIELPPEPAGPDEGPPIDLRPAPRVLPTTGGDP